MKNAPRPALGVWDWNPADSLVDVFMESPFLFLILLIPVLGVTWLIHAFRTEET